MTLSKIIFVAASLSALSAFAGTANANSAGTTCIGLDTNCSDGANLVGKRVTSYENNLSDHSASFLSQDVFSPASGGKKVVKIYESSTVNYDHGVTNRD